MRLDRQWFEAARRARAHLASQSTPTLRRRLRIEFVHDRTRDFHGWHIILRHADLHSQFKFADAQDITVENLSGLTPTNRLFSFIQIHAVLARAD
jgi:hypothetical protein